MLAEIEERDVVLHRIVVDLVAYFVVERVHQMTLLDGQNLVEGTRDVETQCRHVLCALGSLALGQLTDLFLRQITLVGGSEVELVAVFVLLHRAHDVVERTRAVVGSSAGLRQLQMSDTCQLVVHLLLLEAQLLLVGQLLPFATSAHAEMLAARSGAQRTQLTVSDDFCLGVAVLLAAYLQVDYVAWNSPRYKDHQLAFGNAVVGRCSNSHQRLAFSSHIGDGDVFKYREGFLFSCHSC